MKNKEILEQRDRAVKSESKCRELTSELEKIKKPQLEKIKNSEPKSVKIRSDITLKDQKYQQLIQGYIKEIKILKEKIVEHEGERHNLLEKCAKFDEIISKKNTEFCQIKEEKEKIELKLNENELIKTYF